MSFKKSILVLVFVLFFFLAAGSEDCPKGNKITKMSSDMASFKAVGPLDFSKIAAAGAMKKKDGKKVQVVLSNTNFTIKQMTSDFVLPIKKKDQFIAVIRFVNGKDKIVPGTYSAASGYGKPFWAYAEVKLHKGEKGVIVSLSVREGTATITKMTEDSICGTFDLKTKTGSKMKGAISGTFNCKMETSRW